MNSFESLYLIELETYNPMVRETEEPIPLDPMGKKVGFSESGTAAGVYILKILPVRLRSICGGSECLR